MKKVLLFTFASIAVLICVLIALSDPATVTLVGCHGSSLSKATFDTQSFSVVVIDKATGKRSTQYWARSRDGGDRIYLSLARIRSRRLFSMEIPYTWSRAEIDLSGLNDMAGEAAGFAYQVNWRKEKGPQSL